MNPAILSAPRSFHLAKQKRLGEVFHSHHPHRSKQKHPRNVHFVATTHLQSNQSCWVGHWLSSFRLPRKPDLYISAVFWHIGSSLVFFRTNGLSTKRLPVTWLNTIWLNFFVESFGLKILSQVTTKLSQLHSNSRNKYVNSRKYHNVGHMRCMHARPHRRKDQLPLRSLRDLRSR